MIRIVERSGNRIVDLLLPVCVLGMGRRQTGVKKKYGYQVFQVIKKVQPKSKRKTGSVMRGFLVFSFGFVV